MPRAYHLDLDKKTLKGAVIALLPGDPARTRLITDSIASEFNGTSTPLAAKREFTTHLAEIDERSVVVTSTGIGGGSASIAVEELARLGVRTFIRVGTTGALQDYIKTGDCVITTGSVRLDGASEHYAPIAYPAVADFSVTSALIQGALSAGVRFHVGITASSATFYKGEERKDSFRRHTLRSLKGSRQEWRELNVLNFEMESGTILVAASSMGLRAGCITGVINRVGGGAITEGGLRKGEANAIKAAIRGVERLLMNRSQLL